MKNYTKVYMAFFHYSTADFIPCELCGIKAVDIHHIEARSIARGKEKEVENLMALCRGHHAEYGDKKQHREYLKAQHKRFMEQNG